MQRYAILAVLLLLAAGTALAASDGPPCTACHADVPAGHHGAAGVSCSACHGGGAGHPGTAGAVLAFEDEPVAVQDTPCAGCHADSHPVGGSRHQQAGVACHDCHAGHAEPGDDAAAAGRGRLDPASAGCAECHADTLASFRLNERHRLLEGAIGCTDCHAPHSAGDLPLTASAEPSACADCHPLTAGPFVYEHGASRVEGCPACHSPHGSTNRHLLKHQRVGDLCYSCHAEVPQFHLGFAPVGPPRFDGSTVCTNCHVTIHGSNIDPGFLR